MRITILWNSLSSYTVAFFRELAVTEGCELQIIYQPVKAEAPYRGFNLEFSAEAMEDSKQLKTRLEDIVLKFDPDCVLTSSWSFSHFMQLCKKLRRRGVYVVAGMDNQWRGTAKQWLGIISSSIFLKPSIDTFLVAGDRQAYFARKLGYEDVLYGLYAGETEKFRNSRRIETRARKFLFIGRLVDVKGIDLLRDAYRLYRGWVKDPWKLKVVGRGPLRNLLEGEPGIDIVDFMQPAMLPLVMENATCFVLSSRWEPWGVVIHEAAAAGLPIIATDTCGAVTMFVRDGVNGFVSSPKAEGLAYSMLWISKKSNDELEEMRTNSIALANLWNPSMLAGYFASSVARRIEMRNINKQEYDRI